MMTERIKSLDEIKDPEAFLSAYYKAMDDAKDTREENKSLKAELEGKSDEAVAKWRERALKAEARATLESQGIKNPDRILKYLSLDGVDFDDEGNLTGLDDKVNEVKNDFPELFDVKKRAGRNSADIHENKPSTPEKSLTESQVDSWFS